jgi:protein-tyrosine-phosphatase/predicted ATP-grasp superfamily ATP-dependent carboligase
MTNKLHNKTALIFGEDTRSFLTVIRSLYKAGMEVDVVCFSNTSVALQSKYINKVYGLNHQSMTVDNWCYAVERILCSKHYDIVIPCDERALFPLMDIKDKLNLETAFAVPERNIVGPLFNKVDTRITAELCEVTVAKGEHLNLKNFTFTQLTEKFGLPLVLKPTQSYAEEELNKRQSVKIAHNIDDLNSFMQQNTDQLCLVEAYFTGFGVGVSILAKKGQIKAAFAHARVTEPETGGGSSYRKAIPIEPSMLYACQKFCMQLKYTGVAMFEFKFNPKTKDWILIEINARFWGSLPLAVFAGVDFPAMLAHVLLNNHVADKLTYNQSAYARSFTSDIYAIKNEFDNLRQKSGSLFASKQLICRLLTFSRLLTGNDTIDSFSWKDQTPFWAEFYDLFKDKLHKLPLVKQHRQKTRIKYFKKALKQPVNQILFVCYGNIMRSPFAHHLFNKKIEQTTLNTLQSDSFGFHQSEQRSAKPQCIAMAKNWDIDLTTHKSKWIKQNHLSDKSIVIIFDDKNEYFLKSYYPNITYISLADLIPENMGFYKEIEDPYDKPSDYLKQCYQLIDTSLDELILLLQNK